MTGTALACLLSAALTVPAFATDPAPGLRTPQDALDEILAGKTFCRAGDALEEVRTLTVLPGRASEESAVESATLRFDSYCGKKVALLYYKEQGLVPEAIRETVDALWLEGADGRVVKNSEIEDHLETLTRRHYRDTFNKPFAAQPAMLRSFRLFLDFPQQASVAWRLASDGSVPARLYVNQGDTVSLSLVHNINYPFAYANFTLEGYDIRADVSLTTSEGRRLDSFVAGKAGTFSFYDARSPGRIPGVLTVLPK